VPSQLTRRALSTTTFYNHESIGSIEHDQLPALDAGKDPRKEGTEAVAASSEQPPKNPGWVSTDQLGELKESIDIVSAIESYGLDRFERKGNDRATAVCPFHADRNPSLSIDGTRRLYKCFACGAGGDVFNFVREFSKLKGEEITFYQAVRHVSNEFGGGSMVAVGGAGSGGAGSGGPRMSEEERQARQSKKERILLANAAAAAFYVECLTKPFGGQARYHLQSRGLPPATVRAFAMGFAPDAYFAGGRSKSQWGEGSLVYHLRDLGFTPEEILDAGLVVRTKRASEIADRSSRDESSGDAVNGKLRRVQLLGQVGTQRGFDRNSRYNP
jgi:DNA primase